MSSPQTSELGAVAILSEIRQAQTDPQTATPNLNRLVNAFNLPADQARHIVIRLTKPRSSQEAAEANPVVLRSSSLFFHLCNPTVALMKYDLPAELNHTIFDYLDHDLTSMTALGLINKHWCFLYLHHIQRTYNTRVRLDTWSLTAPYTPLCGLLLGWHQWDPAGQGLVYFSGSLNRGPIYVRPATLQAIMASEVGELRAQREAVARAIYPARR